jgi:hypothetical protein
MEARKCDGPSSEGVSALEIQLDALLYEALPIPPFVDVVFEVRVQDLHRWSEQLDVDTDRL